MDQENSVTPWSDVQSSDEYKQLPPDQQDVAKQQYFQQVVAPKVPKEHLDDAKSQFLNDTDPNKNEGFVARTGRYESQNLQSSIDEAAMATQPFKPDHPDDSTFRKGIEMIGQYVGAPLSGTMGAITSPVTSTLAAAGQPLVKEALPNATPNTVDAVSNTAASTLTNIAMSVAGGLKEANAIKSNSLSNEANVPPTPPSTLQKIADTSKPPEDFNILKDVTKVKAPDETGAGLAHNQKISAAYDADKTVMNEKAQALNAEGQKFNLQAPELYTKLDAVISNLSSKVTQGTDEGAALSKLQDIRDNLVAKNGNPETNQYFVPENPKVNATSVSPNDLIDIRKAINSGLNSSKFLTAGKGQLLDLKTAVTEGLQQAAKASPDFGKALTEHDAQATKLGQYKMDALKPVWDPSDYVAWKASQNTEGTPSYTPDTLKRASNFLDNVSNNPEESIAALQKTLPREQVLDIVNDAAAHAEKLTPTFKTAAINLLSHPTPGGLTSTGAMLVKALANKVSGVHTSPLLDLTNRVNGPINSAARNAAITAGAAAAGTIGAASAGPTPKPENKPKSFGGPRSENGDINAQNTQVASNNNSNDSSSFMGRVGQIASSLNPVGEAEAATIKSATKNLDPNSAMAKNVKQLPAVEQQAYEQAGKKYGVNMADALAIRNMESSVGGKALKNGPMQMTDAAWKDSEKAVGRKLDRNNVNDYAEASMAHIKAVRDQIKQPGKGTPGIIDTYIAYNAGVGGYKALMNAKPSDNAVKIVGKNTADNNPNFYYDHDGKPLSVAKTLLTYRTFANEKANEVVPGPKSQAIASNSAQNNNVNLAKNNNEPDMEPFKGFLR